MTHEHRVAIDCPACGQTYVDLDMHTYIDEGHTPTDFADMVWRLTRAHADTCSPRRTRPAPADRRRRALWWWRRAAVPAMAALTILGLSAVDRPAWVSLLLGGLVGWLAVSAGPQGPLYAYRRGYARGRHTAHQRPVPEKDLHPAHRTWLERS